MQKQSLCVSGYLIGRYVTIVKINIRKYETDGRLLAVIIEDKNNGCDGWMAFESLKSAANEIASHKTSSKLLPFTEFTEVYNYGDTEITLQYCADTGDIDIVTDSSDGMSTFLDKLVTSYDFELVT
ncbi:hypothetical protein [Pseudoalteromonas umbrosa]|uniref:hypothetical protein n=1 Tax=Pseudoalteromonas umbrosa TaxID=3048489 RepID=UPI0024C2696C|nr:hypothetical protein [Pseudoalteromonas sp. B95]MDK1286856.1 hypothetical protein [Pseudoalteromonas sp. B95]